MTNSTHKSSVASTDLDYTVIDNKVDLGSLGYMELMDVMGNDLSIANAARVSYNKISDTFDAEKDRKLIYFLAKHKHWTPFEQNSIKFRVKCPIYIARQWMKHRCWVFNEISARYTVFTNTIYKPDEFRIQDTKNKQASLKSEDLDQEAAGQVYDEASKIAIEAYNRLIELGVCREQARGVLPVGSHTEFITTVNLRNYMHWYNLRAPHEAQWEIQQFAKASIKMVEQHFPIAIDCFKQLQIEAAANN